MMAALRLIKNEKNNGDNTFALAAVDISAICCKNITLSNVIIYFRHLFLI